MRRPAGSGLLGLILFLAACGESSAGDATDGSGSDGAALAGRTFVSTNDVGIPGGGPLDLRFTDDGRLLASAGCNSFNGPVQLAGGRLVGADSEMTEMGCEPEVMASDEWLADLLAAEPAWELADRTTLVLTADELVVTMTDRDVLEPPVELTGRQWDVDTLIEGDTASSMPAGVEAYLTFGAGTVTGATGCNEVHGSAVVAGDTIVFTDVTVTLVGCESPAASVEQTVLAVLEGEARFSITGTRLTLDDGAGHGLQAVAAG